MEQKHFIAFVIAYLFYEKINTCLLSVSTLLLVYGGFWTAQEKTEGKKNKRQKQQLNCDVRVSKEGRESNSVVAGKY